MKKVLIAVAMLMLAVSPALAFDLGGYLGPVTFVFANLDTGTLYPADTSLTGQADGEGDSFGILTVVSILNSNTLTPVWSPSAGEAIEGWFYGIDDNDVTLNGVGQGTIESVGGKVDLYLSTPNLLTTTGPVPTMPMADLNAPTDIWNVTDGTLFLSLDLVPGINTLSGDLTTTYHQDIDSILTPIEGGGTGYLAVTGGAYQTAFDSNGFDSIYPGADFVFQLQFRGSDPSQVINPGPTPAQQAAGWLVKSEGGAQGEVIPEPASMILMGIGLFGAARLRRKN